MYDGVRARSAFLDDDRSLAPDFESRGRLDRGTSMSAEGRPNGANCSPSGGSAAAELNMRPQAWGHIK